MLGPSESAVPRVYCYLPLMLNYNRFAVFLENSMQFVLLMEESALLDVSSDQLLLG